MAESFSDRLGRNIQLLELEVDISATCEGQKIGELNVEPVAMAFSAGRTSEGFILRNIKVEKTFQRAGIGFELLACAKEWFYPLRVPESGSAPYLALLAAARRKGLLLKSWPTEHDEVQRLRRSRGRLDG